MDNLLGSWHRMRGGQSKSPAKQKAARINGRKSAGAPNNGRPAGLHQRTLLEYLLRKPAHTLNKDEHRWARHGVFRISEVSSSRPARDRELIFVRFCMFFDLPRNLVAHEMLERRDYTVRHVRKDDWTDMPAILKTFRAWARWGITNKK